MQAKVFPHLINADYADPDVPGIDPHLLERIGFEIGLPGKLTVGNE